MVNVNLFISDLSYKVDRFVGIGYLRKWNILTAMPKYKLMLRYEKFASCTSEKVYKSIHKLDITYLNFNLNIPDEIMLTIFIFLSNSRYHTM